MSMTMIVLDLVVDGALMKVGMVSGVRLDRSNGRDHEPPLKRRSGSAVA